MPTHIDPPAIVHTEDLLYAFIHVTIPRTQMHAILPPTLTELFAAVKAQGQPIVPWWSVLLLPGQTQD